MTVLEVNDLSIRYETESSTVKAVNDVSFTIDEGERLGLVGESGCGKTTIAKSLIGILPENGYVTNGSIKLMDRDPVIDFVTADQDLIQEARWERISMITQSAMNALDPVYTVGEQIIQAIRLHEDTPKKEAKERARNLIDSVGIDEERVNSYPHQLSGGMRQRAMIAMALALDPALILADEPTTALDVITQDHILDQIDELSESHNNSLLMITHDISVVSETCDTVGVMYAGELVEYGPIEEVFVNPEHPYTQGLLNAFPALEEDEESPLITIQGEPPDLEDPPTWCSFYDRCPYAEERCQKSKPDLTLRGADRSARCFVTEDGYDINKNYDTIIKETDKWQRL